MKKLLLIAAILALGTTAFAVSEGYSLNAGFLDTMYPGFITIEANNDAGDAGGFGLRREITNNDNAVHKAQAVNIFRDKGRGWKDHTATLILLKVLKPIKIESEIDLLYTEAVQGDELQIGDIGFRVSGSGVAKIEFQFHGGLFDLPGAVTVKGHNGFYPKQIRTLTPAVETAARILPVYGQKEIEVDIYLDSVGPAGLKMGTIVAIAEYL